MASDTRSLPGIPQLAPRTRYGFWGLDLVAVTVLVGIGALFFWPILSGQFHFIGMPDTSDMILPHEIMITNYLKNGIFPFWSPNNMGGMPLSGYPQFTIFYPLNIAILWIGGKLDLNPVDIYSYHFIFHIILLSVGNYWFARTLQLERIASLVAAVGSSYAPTVLMFDVWANSLPGYSWWGFTLAALILTQRRRGGAWAAIAGVTLGLSILGAPSQPAIQLIFLIAGLFVAQAIPLLREHRRLARLFGRYMMVAAIGLSVGALALLPVMEFANQSVRFLGALGAAPTNEKMGFAAFTEHVEGLKNVGGFLVSELSRTAVGSNFIGAFILLGVVLAGASYQKVKNIHFWYFVAMSAIALAYAFNLMLPMLFYYVPGLNIIREPDRYSQIFVFTLCFLAAFGLQSTLRFERTGFLRGQLVAGVLFVIIAALMIAQASIYLAPEVLVPYKLSCAVAVGWLLLMTIVHKIFRLRMIMAGLFLWGTIWTLHSAPYPMLPYSYYDPRADIASMLRMSALKPTGPEPFRVFAMRIDTPTALTYNADAAMVAGFYDIFGYDNPILMRILRARNLSFSRPIYLSLLNVRYVVTQLDSVDAVRKVIGNDAEIKIRFPDLLVRDGNMKPSHAELIAMENTHRYGAAWLVDHYDVVDRPWSNRDEIFGSNDPQSLMLRTERVDFDARTQAIVDRAPRLANGEVLASSTGEPMAMPPVEWQSYGPNGFKMAVNAPRDSLLVVSELWYPGWQATVNGKHTEIVRADWLLRAVAVPAGPAVVQFEYRPTSVIVGFILCVFGLSCVTVMLLPLLNRGLRVTA